MSKTFHFVLCCNATFQGALFGASLMVGAAGGYVAAHCALIAAAIIMLMLDAR